MTDQLPPLPAPEKVTEFIDRWKDATGTEQANYSQFIADLCQLLTLPGTDVAKKDEVENAYVLQKRVIVHNPDGSTNNGFIDIYKRGCFVLEAKQTGKNLETQGWDKAMLAAYYQADRYARALPASEGKPPFIIVTDVGRTLEIYSEFTRTGSTYVPFPDPGHHRIKLHDLHKPEIQRRLQTLWLDPDNLDPSKHAALVTRQVSDKLATLAKSLEQDGYEVERVAHFLKRCLFTMFAEDVELLPKDSFTHLLEELKAEPEAFADSLQELWDSMNEGHFTGLLKKKIKKFNGGLFRDINPIPLKADQIQLLIDAAKADWRFVEPAIFGTLLERALDPRERHKLGAHYTPRAYVERLVMPTLIEPLREQWSTLQVVAENLIQQNKENKALEELQKFHKQLCDTRVLDPACGSANFLYVALEHMKRLEGEVLNLISDLSHGQVGMQAQGFTVDPHQFLGLEINPRAAAIAEMVLWIGYLQWHYRIHGKLDLPEPILRDFKNIECRDALIEYDSKEPLLDDQGQPITIWDGISYKTSPITGELIPDENQRTPVYHYHNPRKAEWPDAEYIVGNPPFIGASTMRRALGDGYVDAVRKVYKGEVPESADFVIYWWHIAAFKVRHGEAKQFGFITTNSIKQTFNRRVLEPHLNDSKKPLSLIFAIPDHPWVDEVDGAAVRIAMTVGAAGEKAGVLQQVVEEQRTEDDNRNITLKAQKGKVFADLKAGANVASAIPLKANLGISSPGVKLHGAGFIIQPEEVAQLEQQTPSDTSRVIRNYRNGRDLTQNPRGVKVIDLFGYQPEEIKELFPAIYQWVLERVKPERDAKGHTKDGAGYAKNWWLFGKPRQELRKMLHNLPHYIATVETMKHRLFIQMDQDILPDNKLVNIALSDPSSLGILSSRIHLLWSLNAGSRLGMGNDPVYVKTTCLETFPFPDTTPEQAARIGELAEKIDLHRKRQQEQHPDLTLTNMYNVLEKIRLEQPLNDKEKTTHEQGLVSLLRELHNDLDREVFAAYGWEDLGEKLVGLPGATTPLPDKPEAQAEAEEELLMRLVELNHQRAAKEAQGKIRWLPPEYQAPDEQQNPIQLETDQAETAPATKTETASKQTWPKGMAEQVTTVRQLLATAPQTIEALASNFKRNPAKSVEQVLQALEALGQARQEEGLWTLN